MTVDRYLQAATRENTRKSYQSAVDHFEMEWGGFLPATGDSVARYLADHAEVLALSTLRQRLAALSQWHKTQGFPDPTKAPLVKKVLKGIGEVHATRPKQARPLQIHQLRQAVEHLEAGIHSGDSRVLSTIRDKAILLVGFWRAFRSDELTRITAENVEVNNGQGATIYLPRSKTVKGGEFAAYSMPVLQELCPVTAYLDWVQAAGIQEGPVFCGISKSGVVAPNALHVDSVAKILKRTFTDAGIIDAESYSSHSLRRGFATWAGEGGWSLPELMGHVGWKDSNSALRYIDSHATLANKMNQALLRHENPRPVE